MADNATQPRNQSEEQIDPKEWDEWNNEVIIPHAGGLHNEDPRWINERKAL